MLETMPTLSIVVNYTNSHAEGVSPNGLCRGQPTVLAPPAQHKQPAALVFEDRRKAFRVSGTAATVRRPTPFGDTFPRERPADAQSEASPPGRLDRQQDRGEILGQRQGFERADVGATRVASRHKADTSLGSGADHSDNLAECLSERLATYPPDEHVPVSSHVLHRGRLSEDVRALQMTEGLISLTCSPEQLCLLDFSSDERSDCFGETWHVFPGRQSAESAALRRWFKRLLQLFVMHQRSSFSSTSGCS